MRAVRPVPCRHISARVLQSGRAEPLCRRTVVSRVVLRVVHRRCAPAAAAPRRRRAPLPLAPGWLAPLAPSQVVLSGVPELCGCCWSPAVWCCLVRSGQPVPESAQVPRRLRAPAPESCGPAASHRTPPRHTAPATARPPLTSPLFAACLAPDPPPAPPPLSLLRLARAPNKPRWWTRYQDHGPCLQPRLPQRRRPCKHPSPRSAPLCAGPGLPPAPRF